MPSPFPGMDPYLEGSEWVSVHAELSSEIARQLELPPRTVSHHYHRGLARLTKYFRPDQGDSP